MVREIKYKTQNEKSIFAELLIREDTESAFENAIRRGMKQPDNWMYMYSDKGRDYFKHHDTRVYCSYPQYGFVERILNHVQIFFRSALHLCK